MSDQKFHAILLAAGEGKRFNRSGGAILKQVAPYRGKPVIRRLVEQVVESGAFASTRVVLGPDKANNTIIRQALNGLPVDYVINFRSRQDNNLLSFLTGTEGLKDGALVIEADCVVATEDLVNMVRATGPDDITWANIGMAKNYDYGGVILLDEIGAVRGVDVLDREAYAAFKASGQPGMKMFGLTAFGKVALQEYRRRCAMLDDPYGKYFHHVAIANGDGLKFLTVAMTPGVFSFNTIDELRRAGERGKVMREVTFVDVSHLRPLEGHGPKRVLWLKDKILKEGVWKVPLRVERSRHLIMDGHHRFEVAKLLGLTRVPAFLYSYDEVEVYSLRPNVEVSPEIIFANDDKGIIFPYKTAKHRFPDDAMSFEGVPLDELYA